MDIKRNRWLAVAIAVAAVLFMPMQAQAQPAHAETQTKPISPDDHFRAASQTKTFTAATVLLLVDEGLVELDAPIERYLPGVVAGNSYDGNVITVRQILQHSSGIAREAVDPKPNADGTYALAELVRAGLTQAPQFAPGTGFGYSNVNYYLAGMLIERLTGQSYAEAITSPYLPGYQGGRVGPFFYWWETTANLEMSLVTFELGLAGGEVLSASTLAEMPDTVPVPQVQNWNYGLGLMHLTLTCGASLITNTFVNNADAPTRFDVIDSALCEEGTI